MCTVGGQSLALSLERPFFQVPRPQRCVSDARLPPYRSVTPDKYLVTGDFLDKVKETFDKMRG